MKDKLKQKLRSSQGVTLLLSLLVFLVCVVAGSVALTAGTASSGTMAGRYSSDNTISQRAKLDQRYFSVTSAAELLREKFDGKSVRVTGAGAEIERVENDEKKWIPRNDPTVTSEEKFVIDQSLYLLHPPVEEQQPLEYELTINTDNGKINTDNGEINELKAKVTVTFTPSGLIFRLENDNGDTEKFGLQMEYTAAILEEPGENTTTYYIKWQIGTISYAN